MNKVEEWLKQFPLPKFMPGDIVYISRGKAESVQIISVTAYYEADEVEFEYGMRDEYDDPHYCSEENIFKTKEEAEKRCNLVALQDRAGALTGWIESAKVEINRLKELTPTGIEERVRGCEEDINEWNSELEKVRKQLKELEGGTDGIVKV